jgi:hypothetical protein
MLHTRKDNKGFTVNDLMQVFADNPDMKLNTPIVMASDEEGNEILPLVAIETAESGHLVLWPARL